MSNALEPKQNNALANAFAAALNKASTASADIGGSVTTGEQIGVYANMLQQMSPAVVAGDAQPGQWAISNGEQTTYVDSFSGWLLDIIGAPGKAAAVNPAPRKFFYDRNDTELRAMYGDGPHCGSISGISPDPRYVESAAIKAQHGLMDPRFAVPTLEVHADYRGVETISATRLVPVTAGTHCAACQMGQWLRPASGGQPMPPACEATYRALIYVYAVSGDAEWEPKIVILEGRAAAARMFYSGKRDRVFQQEIKGAALYDEGFIETDFAKTYMLNQDGEVVIFPLVVGSIFVSGKSGPYYVPKFMNTGKAFSKYIGEGTNRDEAFGKLGLALGATRFMNGAENKAYKTYFGSVMDMLSRSIIFTSEPQPGPAAAYTEFMDEVFEDYWKRDAAGLPEGRAAMRQPIDPALLQADNQSGTAPAATPTFGGPAPEVPKEAPIPAPAFPAFPGVPSAKEPAVDVQFEDDSTPWDD